MSDSDSLWSDYKYDFAPEVEPKSRKQMQIQIIAVAKTSAMSKANKPYEVLEVTFKNLTFGKVEAKKLMPFGENKSAFDVLSKAVQGETFDIQVVKNAAGYNDWVAAVPAGTAVSGPASGQSTGETGTYTPRAAPAKTSSTYETPEERAKKQVYIIRQSSLSTAVAALSVGTKQAPSSSDVINYAKDLEAFVMGIPSIVEGSGFDDMGDDLPN